MLFESASQINVFSFVLCECVAAVTFCVFIRNSYIFFFISNLQNGIFRAYDFDFISHEGALV